jgi:hypothetical protein
MEECVVEPVAADGVAAGAEEAAGAGEGGAARARHAKPRRSEAVFRNALTFPIGQLNNGFIAQLLATRTNEGRQSQTRNLQPRGIESSESAIDLDSCAFSRRKLPIHGFSRLNERFFC